MEKNYKEALGEEEALSLALNALTEVVEAGGRNLECAIVRKDKVEFLTEERITKEVLLFLVIGACNHIGYNIL